MSKQFDLAEVIQFVPNVAGAGIDAIVQHPDDTSRVATQGICVTFGGSEMREFLLEALEYYRKHKIICQRNAALADLTQ